MAKNSNTLVDEKVAISLFLDSLLTEPALETEVVKPFIQPVVEIKVPEVEVKQTGPVVENKVIVVEPVVPVDDVNHVSEPAVEIKEKLEVEQEIEVIEETSSVIPEWANKPFQILLFKVAGLKLAVPLVDLCGVIKWKDEITEMPGHADFYMGILQHLDYKIAVIDTARMVLPSNKLVELAADNPKDRVNHIVLIDNFRWGLACDNIGEVITLQPNEVRWRTSKTRRGWLAGTVIDHMCALLNSEGFAQMLEKGQSESS